jgi:hypothetical protein
VGRHSVSFNAYFAFPKIATKQKQNQETKKMVIIINKGGILGKYKLLYKIDELKYLH